MTQVIQEQSFLGYRKQELELEVVELEHIMRMDLTSIDSNACLVASRKNELSVSFDALRKIDPVLVNENRSSSGWLIYRIAAQIFYAMNVQYHRCFGNLNGQINLNMQITKEISLLDIQIAELHGKIEHTAKKLSKVTQELFDIEAINLRKKQAVADLKRANTLAEQAFIQANALVVYQPKEPTSTHAGILNQLQGLFPARAACFIGDSVVSVVHQAKQVQTAVSSSFLMFYQQMNPHATDVAMALQDKVLLPAEESICRFGRNAALGLAISAASSVRAAAHTHLDTVSAETNATLVRVMDPVEPVQSGFIPSNETLLRAVPLAILMVFLTTMKIHN